MKKIITFWTVSTLFFGCGKDNYPQCLKGKVVGGDCAGAYVQILSERSPVRNKVAFGNKGNIHYKEVANVFFTDTLAVRDDSISKTFLFQLQPFVRTKKGEDGPCLLLIDTHLVEGTLERYSLVKCN